LEALALKTGQTQLLIETPYRNPSLLSALLGTLGGDTRLAVGMDMALPSAQIMSASVREWRANGTWASRIGKDRPAVFLLGR
jgi:16S rRNA (cytidine1402-2'-O)-methyltransferase